MSIHASNAVATTSHLAATRLLPIMAVVFIAYLVIGLAMPVLPLHVHQGLGFDSFVVGLVAGSQFAASLFSRVWAGHHVDYKGAKHTVITGIVAAVVSGLFYLLSMYFAATPLASVNFLLLGRAALGVAESFIMTGALLWGVGLLGDSNAGKAMAWIGTALFAALAVSAPAGTSLYAGYGFMAIALVAAVLPIFGLPLIARLPATPPPPQKAGTFGTVAGVVWMPGTALSLSGIGFGATTTFVALVYAEHGWEGTWLAFTMLSIAFMVARVFFGHLPDKFGGARVALLCVMLEGLGLLTLWLAQGPHTALAGVTLTGFGYSLVYPALGVEAIRRTPPEAHGLAMGTYTAFFDLTMGIGTPILGYVANRAGLHAVFLVSAFSAFCAAPIAWWLLATPRRPLRTKHV